MKPQARWPEGARSMTSLCQALLTHAPPLNPQTLRERASSPLLTRTSRLKGVGELAQGRRHPVSWLLCLPGSSCGREPPVSDAHREPERLSRQERLVLSEPLTGRNALHLPTTAKLQRRPRAGGRENFLMISRGHQRAGDMGWPHKTKLVQGLRKGGENVSIGSAY